jgi:hypothetical protein
MLEEEGAGLEVLADSAYGSGEVRASLPKAKHRSVIKPIPLRPAVPGGFSIDDFTIDTGAGSVIGALALATVATSTSTRTTTC